MIHAAASKICTFKIDVVEFHFIKRQLTQISERPGGAVDFKLRRVSVKEGGTGQFAIIKYCRKHAAHPEDTIEYGTEAEFRCTEAAPGKGTSDKCTVIKQDIVKPDTGKTTVFKMHTGEALIKAV